MKSMGIGGGPHRTSNAKIDKAPKGFRTQLLSDPPKAFAPVSPGLRGNPIVREIESIESIERDARHMMRERGTQPGQA